MVVLTDTEFQMDVMCRVAVSGYIETGLEGVVYIQSGDVSTAQYIPLYSDGIASRWPENFRRHLSYKIMEDGQRSYFIVTHCEEGMNMIAIEREEAAKIVQRNNALRLMSERPPAGKTENE